MFEIPAGAQHLASTASCANQAFAIGRAALGLQFHPEVDAAHGFERWLVGHALEIASAGLDPRELRAAAAIHADAVTTASIAMLRDWLGAADDATASRTGG